MRRNYPSVEVHQESFSQADKVLVYCTAGKGSERVVACLRCSTCLSSVMTLTVSLSHCSQRLSKDRKLVNMTPLSHNVIWKISDLNREALSLVNIPHFVIKQRCIKSYSCCWDRMLLVGEILISRKLHDILFLPSFLLTKTFSKRIILRVSQSYYNILPSSLIQ